MKHIYGPGAKYICDDDIRGDVIVMTSTSSIEYSCVMVLGAVCLCLSLSGKSNCLPLKKN